MDDLLVKKKESIPILDLSKATCNSKEELRRYLEKLPDFKIKPEKVTAEQVKIKLDKNFTFKSGRKDLQNMRKPYVFMDPLPVEMRELKINDLAAVSIDWKMLTTLRPKNKIEENYFSRLIELGKMQNKNRALEKRQYQFDNQIRKIKNKSGVVEMRTVSCAECREDFCNGKTCTQLGYDAFARQAQETRAIVSKIANSSPTVEKKQGKKGAKKVKKSKSRRRKETKKRTITETT
ncbi:hypothetical protein ABEB36_001761 [Hypothenemus hampei]|uniref:Uncharacterized protein n=1 Tax=Hypothenemus hampei TaxID=57062 RepID=A0ABD1FFQ2_HYPHA